MLKKEYFESITFTESKLFKISRRMGEDYRNKMHWHPFVEILLCLTDHIDVTINTTTYALKYNDMVIIYPGDMHAVESGDENCLLIIQFPSDLLMIVDEIQENKTLFFRFPYISYDPLNVENDKMILQLKEFAEYAESDKPFREVHMYSLLLSFFEKVGKLCVQFEEKQVQKEHASQYKSTKQMAEACLFISHSCTSPLTLEQVADHIGISKSHFAHLFKEYTDRTFLEYLLEERVKRAKILLQDSGNRIIDIAFDSGFTSISAFNRAFKKQTGMSPSGYRKSID